MIGEPVRIIATTNRTLAYTHCPLPEYRPLEVTFSVEDFGRALPTNLRIVLSAHDTLAYDSSWMNNLYHAFYATESDAALADFWTRASLLSDWVRGTFDSTFDPYLNRALSVMLIAELNQACTDCDQDMELNGYPTYRQVARHIFGVQQCLLRQPISQ